MLAAGLGVLVGGMDAAVGEATVGKAEPGEAEPPPDGCTVVQPVMTSSATKTTATKNE